MYQTFTSHAFESLMTYVNRHQGFFTARQARLAGYSPQSQSYHVREGHWEKFGRGIFRLKYFPQRWTDMPDLIVAHLWTCDRTGEPQGVISHGAALKVWDLTTWLGPRIHLTVPKNFRRHSRCTYPTQLHFANLNEADMESASGFRVTTPFKTIMDLLLLPHIESKHIGEAITEALRKGYISHRQMKEAKLTPYQRELLVGLLRQTNYPKVDEI